MKLRTFLLAGIFTVLSACGSGEPPPAPAPAPQGRVETQGIRNTETIGMPGEAIANKVDGALDQSDAQKKKMDDTLQKSAE